MTTAFVFPGQGSQSVGMMAEYFSLFSSARDVFDQANEALGYDLKKLCLEGPVERLNQTAVTQPALLTASFAIWSVWCEHRDERPEFVAGHSLGEYSALVAAGVLSFSDAVKLVAYRGELMQGAVAQGDGAMAAVLGLNDEQVVSVCNEVAKETKMVVSAVNFNAPGQVVIAGAATAMDKLAAKLKDAGAKKVMPLPISVPCHCDLMRPGAEKLAEFIDSLQLQAPSIKVIQNYTAEQGETVAQIKSNLVSQLYSPVLWTQSVVKMNDLGVNRIIECGVGKVLTGLTKRINKSIQCDSLTLPAAINEVEFLAE